MAFYISDKTMSSACFQNAETWQSTQTTLKNHSMVTALALATGCLWSCTT